MEKFEKNTKIEKKLENIEEINEERFFSFSKHDDKDNYFSDINESKVEKFDT